MKNIETKLKKYYSLGVNFRIEQGELRVLAPRESLTDDIVAEIREFKDDIKHYIQTQEQETASERTQSVEISPRSLPISEPVRVSYAQRNLWLSEQLTENPSLNCLCSMFRVRGEFDKEVAESTLSEIIERHQILRTRYCREGAEVWQNVQESQALTIETHSCANEEVDVLIATIRAQPFDLSSDLMVRVNLIKLGEEDVVLVFTMHHIATDGISLGIFVDEFVSLYEALKKQEALQLPQLVVQYADYAIWQNSQFEQGGMDSSLSYWKKQLEGAPVLSFLPTDFPRPLQRSGQGALYVSHISLELTELLEGVAKNRGLTLFMLLHSAFALLLSNLLNQKDIIVGTPHAGRSIAELDKLIGCFTNLVILRTNCDEENLYDFLEHVKQVNSDAQGFQETPFDKLIESFGETTKAGTLPWIQVLFKMNLSPRGEFSLSGLTVDAYADDFFPSIVDIDLSASLSNSRLEFSWVYDTSIFKRETIVKFSEKFQQLLQLFAEGSNVKLNDISLLSIAEKNDLLKNTAPASLAEGSLLHSAFEQAVQRCPEAIAVYTDETSLNYQELNKRANQLANYLLQKNIVPDDVVAIYMHRSMESIVAMLGILKAGGAFLTVDPDLPQERIAYLLESAKVETVVCGSEYLADLAEHEVLIVPIDGAFSDKVLGSCSVENPVPTNLSSECLAYVVYTSGSSGLPKGVMVEHKNIAHFCSVEIRELDIRANDKVLLAISFSFDPAIGHLFSTLNAAATGFLTNAETDLTASLKKEKITHVSLPASVLATLRYELLPDLRVLTVGAEKCPLSLAEKWADGRRFIYYYGPTEATVVATLWEFNGNGVAAMLGNPLDGVSLYILDDHQKLLPRGRVGELYIGGNGVARGYINNRELTDSLFITNPITNDPLDRVYRTGDLVRYLTDGSVEFVGRIDSQVKLNGYRIELGEIENNIHELQDMQSVALSLEQEGDRQNLVAYYVLKREQFQQEVWPSVSEFRVLDDVMFWSMVENIERIKAHEAAYSRKLKDKTVLEVGPGSTLVLTELALNAGAKHVYAVEIDEGAYKKAKDKLASWENADQVTLICGDAGEVALPEKVDYCISSIIGSIGGGQGAEAILSSVSHHLKNSKNMLPEKSVNTMFAVDLSETEFAFGEMARHYTEEIFKQVGKRFDLRVCLKNFNQASIISSGAIFEEIDFRSQMSRYREHKIELVVNAESKLTGFVISLELFIDERSSLDNLKHVDGLLPVYVPLAEPLSVMEQDRLAGRVVKVGDHDSENTDFTVQLEHIRSGDHLRSITLDIPHVSDQYNEHQFYQKLFADRGLKNLNGTQRHQYFRSELSKKLPHYMIPQHFIELDQMPLTSNGKIDRDALPKLNYEEIEGAQSQLESETEKRLSEIWGDLLALEAYIFYRESDFFKLGGHSLLAMQLVGALNQEFDLDLDVKYVFKHSELAKFAIFLDEQLTFALLDRVSATKDVLSEGTL